MKVLCYGSLNIDITFSVPHFVTGGETLSSYGMKRSAGGKGANQAAALAKAGVETYMAGKIGEDGRFLIDNLASFGVDTSNITVSEGPSGQAFIQLDQNAQNAIVLLAGGNKDIREEEIDKVLSDFSSGDLLVLQNEINNLPFIIRKAREKGMRICFNPAPFEEEVRTFGLEAVELLIVNEIEGGSLAQLSGEASYEAIIRKLSLMYPGNEIILTAGNHGAYCYSKGKYYYQPIIDLPVADTTAAGDTFIGYFISAKLKGHTIPEALYIATYASALAVSRRGASESIPCEKEVFAYFKENYRGGQNGWSC